MDGTRINHLLRSLASSRRVYLGGLAALASGWLGQSAGETRRKRKKRKPKKTKPNAYGCLSVGKLCRNAAQCCSGVCEGKQGKRRCRPHDSFICQVDDDTCSTGLTKLCGTTNPYCACTLTTGNAPFCGDYAGFPGDQLCRDCRRDEDCQEEFGPGAACVVYSRLCNDICPDTGRACVPACNDVDV